MEFVPEDEVFVYFRYDTKETVMCIMTHPRRKRDQNQSFAERLQGFKTGRNVVDGTSIPLDRQ